MCSILLRVMYKIDGKGIHGTERLLRGMVGKALEVDRERKCLWMDSEAGGTKCISQVRKVQMCKEKKVNTNTDEVRGQRI